jgi:hypothetical protein
VSKIIGFTLKAEFIRSLGVEPVFVTKTATLWDSSCVNEIRARLVEKLQDDMRKDGDLS